MSKSSKNKGVPTGRRYESIWKAISAAKVGAPVQIRVHTSAARTLIQAVCKEKSRETAIKRRLGMPFAGKLIIDRPTATDDQGFVVISFSLDWDGRQL